jgi:hypothetical protein
LPNFSLKFCLKFYSGIYVPSKFAQKSAKNDLKMSENEQKMSKNERKIGKIAQKIGLHDQNSKSMIPK